MESERITKVLDYLDSNGYLFEEEGHIYPILISPDSQYNVTGDVALPASYGMVSKELRKGRTNYVETADGYVMSTIDRFRNLPHNYMENILDIKTEGVARKAEFSMTKSDAVFQVPAAESGFIQRVCR